MTFLSFSDLSQVNTIPKPPVLTALLLLSSCVLLVAGGVFIFDESYGLSMVFALAAYAVPQAYFCWQAFRFRGARQVRQVMQSFQRGTTGKWILTGVIFAIGFKHQDDLVVWFSLLMYCALIVISVPIFSFIINQPRKR